MAIFRILSYYRLLWKIKPTVRVQNLFLSDFNSDSIYFVELLLNVNDF